MLYNDMRMERIAFEAVKGIRRLGPRIRIPRGVSYKIEELWIGSYPELEIKSFLEHPSFCMLEQ